VDMENPQTAILRLKDVLGRDIPADQQLSLLFRSPKALPSRGFYSNVGKRRLKPAPECVSLYKNDTLWAKDQPLLSDSHRKSIVRERHGCWLRTHRTELHKPRLLPRAALGCRLCRQQLRCQQLWANQCQADGASAPKGRAGQTRERAIAQRICTG
jgi:hypothetical protein